MWKTRIIIICLKPLNKESVISHIASKYVITIEEHSEIGGLGSAIADILCENALNNILLGIWFKERTCRGIA